MWCDRSCSQLVGETLDVAHIIKDCSSSPFIFRPLSICSFRSTNFSFPPAALKWLSFIAGVPCLTCTLLNDNLRLQRWIYLRNKLFLGALLDVDLYQMTNLSTRTLINICREYFLTEYFLTAAPPCYYWTAVSSVSNQLGRRDNSTCPTFSIRQPLHSRKSWF